MAVILPLLLLCHPVLQQSDPLAGQLPKRDLGVDRFLAEFPDYDGRGVRVAVLDTGIDPGHPFLQRTPDGRRKIVDWYDATTDGRVDTSLRAEPVDGALIGLSGRRLVLGGRAGADEYRLGRIDADFLPAELRHRILAERKEEWEKGRREWQEAKVRRQHDFGDAEPANLRQQEIAARWQEFRDPGPVWDLVALRRGEEWRVVIDADEDGDLDEERELRSFRASGDWAVLGDEALLNYAAEVRADGDETVLFFDTNGHGTHVAGIIGAWQGEGGRLNGVAPGVEFVAIKIGDGKFGASTSGFAIAKALDYAVEAGCDVANISFGGPSFFADGREPDAWIIEEATRRGLAVVTSAGNEGPTLTTVGAPATSRAAFAIAAAVWPDTQKANYAALRPVGPVLFDFSSRGPLPTGALGVSFTAPGAALSSLPSWRITPAENFNGTSMAAPQATGCIALLISGARAEGVAAGPERIRRALRLTAEPLPGASWVEQGHGAIRVLPAFAALRSLAEEGREEVVWEVEADNPFGTGAGIYLRDLPAPTPFERAVRIAPRFPEEASHAEQAAFLRTFRLEADQPWIQVPEAVYATAGGRSFPVTIDPTGFEPGLHVGRILLWDADRPATAGPEIVVPVTIVVPFATEAADGHRLVRSFRLEPGGLERTFVRVPYGASRCRVRFVQDGLGRNEYRTGAGSVSGFRYAGDRQRRGRFILEDGGEAGQLVPVEPGTVFEYTIASRWAVNRPAGIRLELEFLGVVPQEQELVVPAGQGIGWLALKSPLRSVDLRCEAGIDGVARPVTADWKIVPDPIRSTVMGGRGMFQAVLEWPVVVPAGGARLELVMPRSIQTTEIREDLMLVIRDQNGVVVGRHIAYEKETDLGRLDEGTYTFRLAHPSLGQAPLAARYAGAEVRIHLQEPAPSLAADLAGAFAGGEGSVGLRIPFGGSRLLAVRVPELPALAGGAYYFGTVRIRSGGDDLLSLPLRIERPAPAGEEAGADEDAAEPGAEERAAYERLSAGGGEEAAEPAARLAAARAWAEAAPSSGEAELAVLRELAAAGLAEFARDRARSFLGRFPALRDAFLAAAPAWNP